MSYPAWVEGLVNMIIFIFTWSIHENTSRDKLISDVLLWTPTHGRAKAGRPAWTYIQQLCEDTGCWPEDLPRAMNDREEWRERVRDIRATSAIWWWWYIYMHYLRFVNPVSSDCRIHRLQKGNYPHSAPNKCLGYDTKLSDGEPSVWTLGECGILLHCYYSQIHSDLEW